MNNAIFALLMVVIMFGGIYYWARSKWARKFFGEDSEEMEKHETK